MPVSEYSDGPEILADKHTVKTKGKQNILLGSQIVILGVTRNEES